MRLSALVSGGKDSIYSAYLAESQGWEVEELVTLVPRDPDSLLFHTPNLSMVRLQAEAWGKRHREVPVRDPGEAAEGAALRAALETAAPWVSAGAIASSYQWARLGRVTHELGRRLFTPLWGKEADRVVRAEIAAGLDIRFVHLAAEPFTEAWAGRRLDAAAADELARLAATVRPLHLAGEGGEYETLVVDAPFFRSRIVLDRTERQEARGVTRLVVREAHLEPK